MKRCTGYRNFLDMKQFVCLTYGFRMQTGHENRIN